MLFCVHVCTYQFMYKIECRYQILFIFNGYFCFNLPDSSYNKTCLAIWELEACFSLSNYWSWFIKVECGCFRVFPTILVYRENRFNITQIFQNLIGKYTTYVLVQLPKTMLYKTYIQKHVEKIQHMLTRSIIKIMYILHDIMKICILPQSSCLHINHLIPCIQYFYLLFHNMCVIAIIQHRCVMDIDVNLWIYWYLCICNDKMWCYYNMSYVVLCCLYNYVFIIEIYVI